MSVAIVTGSSGLIGSETARFLHDKGMEVVGIDNNMRAYFFGEDGSTDWNAQLLKQTLARYDHLDLDIRDREALQGVRQLWPIDRADRALCGATFSRLGRARTADGFHGQRMRYPLSARGH